MSATAVDVSVLIVSWNSAVDLPTCLNAVALASQEVTLETILVDNGSTDGSVEMVNARYPWVRSVLVGRNVGFAAACNRGLSVRAGRDVLLLNPDAVLHAGAMSAMSRRLRGAHKIAAVAPVLLNSDGSLQGAGERYVDLREFALARILRWRRRIRPKSEPYGVPWASGACLMLNGQAICEVGGLSEAFWLYSEDMEWCWRARKCRWEIEIVPYAKVTHSRSQSSVRNLREATLGDARSTLRWLALYSGKRAYTVGRILVIVSVLERALLSVALGRTSGRVYMSCVRELLSRDLNTGGSFSG